MRGEQENSIIIIWRLHCITIKYCFFTRFDNDNDKKEYSWGKTEVKKEGENEGEKEKPNFGLSGKLTADANTVNGVVIKYTEPDDAKQPKRRWR